MPETAESDLVALVDENDTPIGAVSRAQLTQSQGIHFRTAHGFLFDQEGQLLLQQLAQTRDRNPLRWGSSVAAYVRPGESYREAAFRRCVDELGVWPDFDLIGNTVMPDQGRIKHIALHAAGVAGLPVEIREPEHVAALAWVPLDEVRARCEREPDAFTETFLWLFQQFYGDGREATVTA